MDTKYQSIFFSKYIGHIIHILVQTPSQRNQVGNLGCNPLAEPSLNGGK